MNIGNEFEEQLLITRREKNRIQKETKKERRDRQSDDSLPPMRIALQGCANAHGGRKDAHHCWL
jgi:hypothetical protein